MSNTDQHIMLRGVRVSFPHLFKLPTINNEEGSCGAVLMLDQSGPNVARIENDIREISIAKWKREIPSDKRALRAGEDKGRPEYDGYMVISANCKAGKFPLVVDASGTGFVSDESQCAIYPGCYVDAKIRLWAQDNKFGKRVNAELIAIRFSADGDALDDSYVSAEDAIAGFGPAPRTTSDPGYADANADVDYENMEV